MTVFLGVHDMNNLDGAVKRKVSKIITHPGKPLIKTRFYKKFYSKVTKVALGYV